ncbi:hypothetical protein [Natrinema pallidum]|nr:hypothetical protein [Natrinema pallidum]
MTNYTRSKMPKLADDCMEHLEKALQSDDPSEKNFHIRQVIQAYGVDHLPDEIDSQ